MPLRTTALPRGSEAGFCWLPVGHQTLLFLSPEEPVCSSLYGSRFLTGGLGGSVTHQCFYSPTPANKHERKYWCKVAANGVCYTIASSSSYTLSEYRGRVALGDAPQNGTFTVTMAGLRSSDAGTYRCGIGSTNDGLYVSLNLTVLAGRVLSWERFGVGSHAAGASAPSVKRVFIIVGCKSSQIGPKVCKCKREPSPACWKHGFGDSGEGHGGNV